MNSLKILNILKWLKLVCDCSLRTGQSLETKKFEETLRNNINSNSSDEGNKPESDIPEEVDKVKL